MMHGKVKIFILKSINYKDKGTLINNISINPFKHILSKKNLTFNVAKRPENS